MQGQVTLGMVCVERQDKPVPLLWSMAGHHRRLSEEKKVPSTLLFHSAPEMGLAAEWHCVGLLRLVFASSDESKYKKNRALDYN